MPITNTPSIAPVAANLYRVTVSFTAPNGTAAKKVHAMLKGIANSIGTAMPTTMETKVKNVRLDERKDLQPFVRNLRRPRSGKVWKNLAKNRG